MIFILRKCNLRSQGKCLRKLCANLLFFQDKFTILSLSISEGNKFNLQNKINILLVRKLLVAPGASCHLPLQQLRRDFYFYTRSPSPCLPSRSSLQPSLRTCFRVWNLPPDFLVHHPVVFRQLLSTSYPHHPPDHWSSRGLPVSRQF